MKSEAIANSIRNREPRPSVYALISEFRCGYQQARAALEIAFGAPHPSRITESQLLELSGYVSNQVTDLTNQPITESEDCHLAQAIGQWLRETGIEVTPDETHKE